MADYGYTVPGTQAWTQLASSGAFTDLATNMSANAEIWLDNLPDLWEQNCASIFAPLYNQEIYVNVSDRSLYEMWETDGRLCADYMTCAYPYCTYLDDDRYNPSVGEADTVDEYGVLPAISAAPGCVADVVRLVEFADQKNIQVSVKIAGHSFLGQSYVKDSILISMTNMPKYADGENTDSITVCDGDTGEYEPSLPDEMDVCDLAYARNNTPGVIRSGGGVIWDEFYRSVSRWNDENGFQLHVLGGFSGTVGVNGGYWQGGGLAAGGGMRWYGVSADQVLMIEMVLPNGEHVRFRPTEWEEVEDSLVPQTRVVTGWCNQNPYEEDEEDWEWEDCSHQYDFEDLWYATRGGGGGTWGVVTNSWYGLLTPPAENVSMFMMPTVHDGFPAKPTQDYCDTYGEEKCTILDLAINEIWNPFWIDFFNFPENLEIDGVDESISFRCNAGLVGLYIWSAGAFICYGEVPSLFISSWAVIIDRNRDYLIGLDADGGITDDLVDAVGNAFQILATSRDVLNLFFDTANLSYWGQYQASIPEGRLRDAWNPAAYPPYHDNPWASIIPTGYFTENRDEFIGILNDMGVDIRNGDMQPPITMFGLGGRIPQHSDGMNAVRYRDGMLTMSIPTVAYQERILTSMFGDGPCEGPYPGLSEFNHVGNREYGPLKSDWTKACDLSWPVAVKNELCVSVQEACWGGEILSRLEQIKEEVDPKHIFNCFASVGYVDTNQPAPSPQCEQCHDSPYKFKVGGKRKKRNYKTCQWVKNKRNKRCRNEGYASMCPRTCGKCNEGCKDGELKFKFSGSKKPQSCGWVGASTSKRCDLHSGIALTCPVTCEGYLTSPNNIFA